MPHICQTAWKNEKKFRVLIIPNYNKATKTETNEIKQNNKKPSEQFIISFKFV